MGIALKAKNQPLHKKYDSIKNLINTSTNIQSICILICKPDALYLGPTPRNKTLAQSMFPKKSLYL